MTREKRTAGLGLTLGPRVTQLFTPKASAALALALILLIGVSDLFAQSSGANTQAGIAGTIWKWLPLILFGPLSVHLHAGAVELSGQLGGFALNVLVSAIVMLAGTILGVALGLALVSESLVLRRASTVVTQFFRNTPWLVLLFFAAFLLPFRVRLFGLLLPLPDWFKASMALTLPIMANVAEITRGAIQSIAPGQWLAAQSLGFNRRQTLALIVLPQCVKRMIPPWMNWYAILAMESSLISVVGVNEAMTMTHDALAAEGRDELLIPMYGMLLLIFFAYCYPIARWTAALERRFAVS
jgi:polar amino acid transport system permease protein